MENEEKKGKPFYKKPWFIAVVVVVVLMIAVAGSGGSDSTEPGSGDVAGGGGGQSGAVSESGAGGGGGQSNAASESGAGSESSAAGESSESSSEKKTSSYDWYRIIANNMSPGDDCYYQLNEKATAFLQENLALFPTTDQDACLKKCDQELSYAKIEKNASKYGDKLMCLPTARVIQISERKRSDGGYLTELNLKDYEGNHYYVYYLGELEEIFAEDEVFVYGLPLGMGSFSNTNGGTTLCPILAGCFIERCVS